MERQTQIRDFTLNMIQEKEVGLIPCEKGVNKLMILERICGKGAKAGRNDEEIRSFK